MDKALYGTLQDALLLYENVRGELQKMCFKINPYNRCVANKVIKGNQCPRCWYVDDNKISHEDKKVVTEIWTGL